MFALALAWGGAAVAQQPAGQPASQSAGQPDTVPRIEPAPAFTGERLASLPREDWITNGGNVYNQRYSPLDEIERSNVEQLRGVWRTHLNGSGLENKYSGEAQPIVYEGVVYIVTGADDVFAVSVESGELLWSYEAGLDPAIDVICCGWTSRGVGLGEGKVFVGQLDGSWWRSISRPVRWSGRPRPSAGRRASASPARPVPRRVGDHRFRRRGIRRARPGQGLSSRGRIAGLELLYRARPGGVRARHLAPGQ